MVELNTLSNKNVKILKWAKMSFILILQNLKFENYKKIRILLALWLELC